MWLRWFAFPVLALAGVGVLGLALAGFVILLAYPNLPSIEALTEYGERVGMVFQIVDDILDVVATDEELGKPSGNDLLTGVYTLPVILAVAEGDELRNLLGHPLEGDALDQARQIVRSNGAVPRAVDVARRYVSQAADTLADLPDGPAVAALRDLGDRLVDSVPA